MYDTDCWKPADSWKQSETNWSYNNVSQNQFVDDSITNGNDNEFRQSIIMYKASTIWKDCNI